MKKTYNVLNAIDKYAKKRRKKINDEIQKQKILAHDAALLVEVVLFEIRESDHHGCHDGDY